MPEPVATPPVFTLRNPTIGMLPGFSLLRTGINAGANADQPFFAEMRKTVIGIPLVDAGVQIAEALAQQQSDLAHLLIDVMNLLERVIGAGGNVGIGRWEYAPEALTVNDSADPYAISSGYSGPPVLAQGYQQGPDIPEATTQQRAPVLEVTVPHGTLTVAVPLLLRNHRQCADTVSLSSTALNGPDILPIPSQSITFDPDTLVLPPLSEASVQLHLQLRPALEHVGEYWSELIIDGIGTKRVPLALRVLPAFSADGQQAVAQY
jgi:hypothetical protein